MTEPDHQPTNQDSSLSPVTVVGLGAMGTALATAFIDAGHPTTVWNRSPGKAAALADRGATAAASVREAVVASDLVVVCVVDYDAVEQVLTPVGDVLRGRVVVNLTTGVPDEARRMADWAVEQGAGYLDGGIMAVPSLVSQPEAFILYSGSDDVFQAHQQTLERLGTITYVGADPGLAALYDLSLLSGMYGMFGGFLHAVALVGTAQVEATEFTSSLLIPWLQAMITTMPEMARQVDTGDYTAEEASLEMQTSGTGIAEFSETQGISGALLAPLEALMNKRVADGHGGDDLPGVIELLKKPAQA